MTTAYAQRGRALPLMTFPTIPPGSAVEKALAPLLAQHQRVVENARTTRAALTAVEQDRAAARRRDMDAYAAALRDRQPDPGPVAVRENEQQIADLQRKVAALLAARMAVQDEIVDLLNAHAAEFRSEAEAAIAANRKSAVTALAALKDAVAAMQESKALVGWLRNPRRNPAPPAPYVPGLVARSGDLFHVGQVLVGLDAWLAGETEPAVTGYLDDDFAAKHLVTPDQ